MNCEGCSLALEEGQATAAVACCQRVYHTKCLVTHSYISGYESSPVLCGCNTVLYTGNNWGAYQPVPYVDVGTFLENEENRAQVKRIIQKSIDANKAQKGLNRILREKINEYKSVVKPYSDSIKALKKEAQDALRATPQWKEVSNKGRSYTAAVNKFRRDHALNHRDVLNILGTRRGLRRRDSPSYMLRRLTRMRV